MLYIYTIYYIHKKTTLLYVTAVNIKKSHIFHTGIFPVSWFSANIKVRSGDALLISIFFSWSFFVLPLNHWPTRTLLRNSMKVWFSFCLIAFVSSVIRNKGHKLKKSRNAFFICFKYLRQFNWTQLWQITYIKNR